MKIYVASSWRNEHQQAIVKRFRDEGHEVYDFRNPLPGQHGFSWKETSAVPPEQWTVDEFNVALDTEPAKRGFGLDMAALIWCDVCVCVLPSGKDAHLEVGWAAGARKRTAVLLLDYGCRHVGRDEALPPRGWEPGLMYKMCDLVTGDVERVSGWLRSLAPDEATCAKNLVGGCALHNDRSIGTDGLCSVGRSVA